MSADTPGFAAAQRAWEAMLPPEDGPCECSDCNGKGELPDPTDEDAEYIQCKTCDGFGMLTARGDPFDPDKAEREECEYADHKRDEERLS